MTTYQIFNRRVNRTLLYLIATFLVVVIARGALPRTRLTYGIVYWGSILVFVSMLWSLTRTRCLFCGKPVGVASLTWISRGGGTPEGATCPNCGASIQRNFPGITDETI